MKIEIIDANVTIDGKEAGTIGPDGAFYPVKGLHHKRKEAVEKFLAVQSETPETPKEQEKPAKASKKPASEPPAMDADKGDKTPAFMAWLKENDPKAFEARYKGRKVPEI